MAEIVNMPKLGFDMAEGTLERWVIGEGESVEKGAVLAEIETDKATVEVESNYDGVVVRHIVDEGTPVPVGDPIAVIGEPGEEVDVDALIGAAAEEEKPAEKEKKEPVEEAEEKAPRKPVAAIPEKEAAPEGAQLPGGVRASPLARRMAEEEGIDLQAVQGSGPKGRIVKQDIQAYLEKKPEAKPVPAPAPAEKLKEEKLAVPMPFYQAGGPLPEDQRIPRSRLRHAVGRRMVESKQQVPHFYVTHEYDMQPLMDLRKQVNEMLVGDERISVNDFLIKAIALALRQFPNLNASLDGDDIIHHGRVNIGVAVAVEGGLLTVVCKDADRKPLRQISAEIKPMIERARAGKVKADDVEGSTFSISNMGMYDVENFSAIINPPEAAIMAVGSAMKVPVVQDGEIKPGLRMKMTISIDHRVSDGAEGARFLQMLANYIEEPMRLLL
jgi:pyruvate dehydrogenase E2 component (dihydrolipoamide acetyltransferase)